MHPMKTKARELLFTFYDQSAYSLVYLFCDFSQQVQFWHWVKQWLQKNLGMDIT